MKQFDMGNITKRADRLLEEHMGMIDGERGVFEKQGGGYYLKCENDDASLLRIGYAESNRFLSRVYNMEFKNIITPVDFPADFKARIRFRGFKEIQGAVFVTDPKDRWAAGLLNDARLPAMISEIAGHVDVAALKLEYIAKNKTLTLSVIPYAGAYIWVKFPPAFYGMRLKKEEMRQLLHLTQIIGAYFERKQSIS
jgi:virulence-associated protein VapD